MAKKSMIVKANRPQKYKVREYTRCDRCGRPHSVLKKYGVSSWLWAIILSILTIICGVLLIINPNIGALMFTTILGMLFIVYSISDIIDLIIFKKNANTIAKIFK